MSMSIPLPKMQVTSGNTHLSSTAPLQINTLQQTTMHQMRDSTIHTISTLTTITLFDFYHSLLN
jgi:hypothetical protein